MTKYIVGLEVEAPTPEEAKEIFLDLMVDNLFDAEEVIIVCGEQRK